MSKLSLEELWQLFPIILRGHNAEYKKQYYDEKERIIKAVNIRNIKRISHIGSTYVERLIAKPTVDILLEINDNFSVETLKENLVNIDYICVPQPDNPPPHLVFYKGYTPKGFAEKVFHLHVRYFGDWGELYFREYLTKHKDVAIKYGELKTELQKKYEHNRDAYTKAKTEFISAYTKTARDELKNKYKYPDVNYLK